MSDLSWSIGIPGILKIDMGPETVSTLGRWWNGRSRFSGPCLVIDRWSGLALDATVEPQRQTQPVLWTVHGEPWQRWRLVRLRNKRVLLMSDHGGLVLTTDSPPGDRSWVWLDSYRGYEQQEWNVTPSDDGCAFQIESATSAYALDARDHPRIPATGEDHAIADPSSPVMMRNANRRTQEWTIARLP